MRPSAAAAIALFVVRAPAPAQDSAALARIQRQLATPAVFCGTFEQSKTLVGVKQPVRSSGRFCVVAGKGILWRTIHPFASSLLITRDAITEKRSGETAQRISAEQEPGVRAINDLLFSLFGGDLSRLAASFEVTGSMSGANWTAKLTPRTAGMRTVIAGIELQGGAFVQRIALHDAGGDRTIIVFSGIATGSAAMQPEEAQQLE
jgi:hypothetical protein